VISGPDCISYSVAGYHFDTRFEFVVQIALGALRSKSQRRTGARDDAEAECRYSVRSAAIGSTFMARLVGTYDAMSATTIIANTATIIGAVVFTGSFTGASA
jgi:hypothetical protein